MRKLTMVNSVEWTNEKFPVHVPLSCAVGGESRMHGAHGGVGETCRKVTRPDPTHSFGLHISWNLPASARSRRVRGKQASHQRNIRIGPAGIFFDRRPTDRDHH